jgi:hypothetical protein
MRPGTSVLSTARAGRGAIGPCEVRRERSGCPLRSTPNGPNRRMSSPGDERRDNSCWFTTTLDGTEAGHILQNSGNDHALSRRFATFPTSLRRHHRLDASQIDSMKNQARDSDGHVSFKFRTEGDLRILVRHATGEPTPYSLALRDTPRGPGRQVRKGGSDVHERAPSMRPNGGAHHRWATCVTPVRAVPPDDCGQMCTAPTCASAYVALFAHADGDIDRPRRRDHPES